MTEKTLPSSRSTAPLFQARPRTAWLAVTVVTLLALVALPSAALAAPAAPTSVASVSHVAPGPAARAVAHSSALPGIFDTILSHPMVSMKILHESLDQRFTSAAPTSSNALASPRPSVLSGNSYLGAPCSNTSSLTAVNGTNNTLLAGLSSNYLIFNVSGGTFCTSGAVNSALLTHGLVESERSKDGGQTWTPSWIPANTSWTTKSSPMNGSIPGFFYPIPGGGAPFASPAVAAANNGVALLATQFTPQCILLPLNCSSAPGLQAPSGIAVARSTDGGASWTNTTVIGQTQYLKYLTPTAACQTAGFTAGYYFTNVPLGPAVAINPVSDVAVAAWENFNVHWDWTAGCVGFISGVIQESTSSNGGVSWSAPTNVSGNLSFDPQIAIGPAPHYDISIAYQNWFNSTFDNATGALAVNWATVTSTTNGTTWATPVDTGSAGDVNLLWHGGTQPDAFQVSDNPFTRFASGRASYAIDASSTSSHVGNSYLVWADNQTAGASHQGKAAIAFQVLTSGGLSWTTPTLLTAPTSSVSYFEPAISVGADGTIWVTFFGESSGGSLSLYALHSTNGGTTWSAPSVVTTQSSPVPSSFAEIGMYNGLAATTAGTYATWGDCRSLSCTSSYNFSVMATLIEPVTLASNQAGLNLTLGSNGVAGALVAVPGSVSWAVGSQHTAVAPGWLPHNATDVASFANYSGAMNSTSFQVSFTYNGGSQLFVTYVFVPAGFIAGTFQPNTTQSKLWIDGTSVPLHPGPNSATLVYNDSVASGRTYFLNASASNFYSSVTNHQLGVSAGVTTVYNIVLGKTVGWITGHVSPANATVTVNGTPVVVNTSGGSDLYNVTEQWGWYWVNASGFGITNSSHYVQVQPSAATTNSISLIGGWIKGTLAANYPGAKIKVDGVSITSIVGVTFNNSYLGGTHEISATAPGYNTTFFNVSVTPARTTFASISLTNVGEVQGTIGPSAALSTAELVINNVTKNLGGPYPIKATSGAFFVNLTGEINYTVTVKATGYNTTTQVVFVRPGHVTGPLTITLSPASTKCVTNCSKVNPPGNGSTGSSGISPLLIGGIIVVVVLVAAVAAVLVMRRRGGGSSGEPQYAPQDESTAGQESGDQYGGGTYGSPPPPPPGAQ